MAGVAASAAHRWAAAWQRGTAHLPSQCELCRGWGRGGLCALCTAQHAAAVPRCRRCGAAGGTFDTELIRCGACLQEPPTFAATVCALDYGFPWDALITRLKFHHRAELAGPLARCLADAVARDARALAERPLVVPVPLSRARLAERGFNQAWELARRVARWHGLPACAQALSRVVETPAQAGLTRSERQRNLRNAFVPSAQAPLQGAAVALVDDVMTTGATAHEAAAALLRGGARSVQLWVLARTPAPAFDGLTG